MCYISEAPHAREALYLAPWLSKSTHPRKFGNHVTVRPHHRKTNVYSLSLGAQERTNCISVLRSIDSCQNRASADQYHLTVPRAQGSTHRGRVFFEVIRWQITCLKWSQAQVCFFQWFISNMFCLCHYGPALLGFGFQTDFWRENSASFFKSTGGEDLILPWGLTLIGA